MATDSENDSSVSRESRSTRISLKTLIEVFGVLAVVVSLLLLAYEVRQSNRIARATTTYEISRDVNQFNELGYSDPTFAALLLNLNNAEFEPTPVEALQIRLLAHRFVNVWSVQEAAYRNGLLTEAQFTATRADVVTVMEAFPRLNEHWPEVLRVQPGLRELEVLRPLIENEPGPE